MMNRSTSLSFWALLLAVAVSFYGCSGGGDGNAGGPGTPSGEVGGSGDGGTGARVAAVDLASSTTSIGLSEQATLTATVTTSAGDPLEKVEVTFTIASGPAVKINGSPTSAKVITNPSGEAKAYLTPGSSGGEVVIVATAGGISSDPVSVEIAVATAETLTVTILPGEITQNGEAILTATIADADGNPIALRTIDFDLVPPVPTGVTIDTTGTTDGSGTASATITPGTELGTVTASASIDGLTNTASLEIITASSGSIEFVSAVPSLIGVIGSGSAETSVVTFEVHDEIGGLVADGTTVTFELVGPGGGESLLATTALTSAGQASAVVTSGTVAGAVRVIARVTLGGKILQTASNNITVGSGPPSQNHVSLARAPINFAGRVLFGEESEVTFFGADRFSNFVPVDSAPAFVSEAGGIQPPALTEELGTATVTLQSQSPTPSDGIADVLTFIVGEESFVDEDANGRFDFDDTNGNGVHDAGEPSEQFFDIGEPFIDQNDNGVWDGDDPDTTGVDEAATSVSGDRTFVGAADGTGADFNSSCGAAPTSRGYFFDLNRDGAFEHGDFSNENPGLYDPGSGDVIPDVPLNGLWVEGNGFAGDDCTYCPYDEDANNNGLLDADEDLCRNGKLDTADAFIDPSGDGRYQNGLDYTDLNSNARVDAGEAFIQEVFFDGEQNGFRDGAYDGPNGSWDDRLFVFDRVKMFFSGPTRMAATPDSINLDPGESATVWIYVGDDRGLPLATGSKVTIGKGEGSVGQMVGTGSFDILDGSGTRFAVTIVNNLSSGSNSGVASVTVEVDAANGSFGATIAATAILEAPL
jgi:hypothetical protein